jgi:TatD DNase family protein
MVDVHCHLNFHSFENDLEETIKRANEAGVEKIINVGTSIESSLKAVELSEKYDNLYAIVGIHPHHADKLEKGWEKVIEALAGKPKVIGIGEIGLDYFSYKSNGIVEPKLQKEVFETQIEISRKADLPLQIHNRQAGKDVIEILKHHKNLLKDIPGMFHCFAADFEVQKNALGLGFYLGFDGNITYEGLAKGESIPLPELVKKTPVEKLVVETDSPFLTPVPYRGSRNEPGYVIITAKHIAQILNLPFEVIRSQTTKNAAKIFDL